MSRTSNQPSVRESFFDKIFDVFKPSNPLIGSWQISKTSPFGDVDAKFGLQYTFDQTEATINGSRVKVHYEVKGDTVTVLQGSLSSGAVFQVIDRDHIRLATAFGESRFDRIKN